MYLVDSRRRVTVFRQRGRRPARPTGGIDDQIGTNPFLCGPIVTDDHPLHGRPSVVDEVVRELATGSQVDPIEVSDAPSNHVFEKRSSSTVGW